MHPDQPLSRSKSSSPELNTMSLRGCADNFRRIVKNLDFYLEDPISGSNPPPDCNWLPELIRLT